MTLAIAFDDVTLAPPELGPEVLEAHRRELTGYCYRMLGSVFEADDAVQETLVRAWRAADSFEGRSSVRSWLYRIATNVCLDLIKGRERRARPMDLGPWSPPDESLLGPTLPEDQWVSPITDDRVLPLQADPEVVSEARESIRLAFVTALQHLPPRQRAALILCEVLRFHASEAANLLETSVAGVNSALQRARATLSTLDPEQARADVEEEHEELLSNYVEAFEAYDIPRLVKLLAGDAVQSMPPFALWLKGAEDIGAWMVQPGPLGCKGSVLVPTRANGRPAFGQYRVDPEGGHAPWALQVLEIRDGKIVEMSFFLAMMDPRLFSSLGLPEHLPA